MTDALRPTHSRRPTRTKLTDTEVHKFANTSLGSLLLRRESSVLAAARGRWGAPQLLSDHSADTENNDYVAFPLRIERIAGDTLAETIISLRRTGHPLPVRRSLQWLSKAAEAIDRWHAGAAMVHGDVSPGNWVIGETGGSMIDFGLATAFGCPVTLDAHILANPAYASPEQLRGQAVDARSDVFSLAVVATELLTGRRYRRGETRFDGTQMGPPVAAILESALCQDPTRRPDTCRSLTDALSHAIASTNRDL